MKFCTHCGKELFDEAVICPGCGCAVGTASVPAAGKNDLLTKLSERVKMNAIIWIVIGVLQVIIGLCGTWLPLIVGVLNLVSAAKDMTYSKTVLENPNGVVKNFESLTSPIITQPICRLPDRMPAVLKSLTGLCLLRRSSSAKGSWSAKNARSSVFQVTIPSEAIRSLMLQNSIPVAVRSNTISRSPANRGHGLWRSSSITGTKLLL